MRKGLQKIEIIENYLMGKMNSAEKAEFEKQLEKDFKLAESVQLQKDLVAGLERIGLKKDLLKAKRSLFMRNVWMWFGVALLLTGLAFGGWMIDRTEFVTQSDSRSEMNDKGLNIKGDSEFLMQIDSRSEIKGDDTAEFVMLSDGRSRQTVPNDSTTQPDFAKIPVKQFQTFVIDQTKANNITGKEGTIIEFPANAFQTESDQEVTIKLKEFYKLSDIVFANLTTQTKNGQLIETGGMVQIEASQPSISKLNLAPDKSITLKLPCEMKKKGMKTFTGGKDDLGHVVWELGEKFESSVINYSDSHDNSGVNEVDYGLMSIGDESNRMKKMFAKLDGEVEDYLIENLRIPILPKKQLKGFIYISFTVEENGIVSETNVRKAGDASIILYDFLKKTAKNLPPIVPCYMNGQYLRTSFEIRIDIDKSFSLKMLGELELTEYYEVFERRRGQMTEATEEDFDKKLKQQRNDFEDELVDDGLNRKNQNLKVNQYLLTSSNLGYINCDRYPFATKGKSSFNILENDRKINCSLVLHSVRGIVKPRYIKRGKYIFPQLPNEEQISILAFKTKNQQNYVSYSVTTHNKQDHVFEFEPLTKEKLQQITRELDAIKN